MIKHKHTNKTLWQRVNCRWFQPTDYNEKCEFGFSQILVLK
jgi:hypothetical protein